MSTNRENAHFETLIKDKRVEIGYNSKKSLLIVSFLCPTIPMEELKMLFHNIYQITTNIDVEKIVLDMRQLKAFDPNGMKWVFSEWRQRLDRKGVRQYRIITPDSHFFKHAMIITMDDVRISTGFDYKEHDFKFLLKLEEGIDA